MPFLTDRKSRPWAVPAGGKGAFTAAGYYLGQGTTPIEVAIASAPNRPTESDVRNLWKRRKGNQPSPLLLIITWPGPQGELATMCGVTGDEPAVYSGRDPGQAERLASLALAEPDHHTAVRFLSAYLPEEAGGLRNVSLFATHHLAERVPRRPDWPDLCKQGVKLLGLRREQLVAALGFTVEPKGRAAVLRVTGHARALAVFLDDTDNPDTPATLFNGMTPVSWAIASAAADNIPYVILTRGPQIRVYTTRAAATGNGGTGAFVEINLPLLTPTDAGYLPLLCAAESLAEDGRFQALLEDSHNFAADLGTRLRSRVYDQAVPFIAQALVDRHVEGCGATDDRSLLDLYDRSLLVLFRLLFVAYSEDRDLLPLRTNGLYRQRSLKHKAREFAELANTHGWEEAPFDEHSTDLWDDVRALWAAVDNGRKEWNVPKYNGGMFSSDPAVSAEGAALASIELTNAEFGPALRGLLVDESDGGWGPIDFASLDVREFGTIYEGLLESSLAVAPCDLTLNEDDSWVPAGPKDDIWVDEGSVYLHNKSGARKASGSYFTKPFAVDHLLDHALEPALDDHIERLTHLLKSGDESGAADAFFDFRCIDLAMGSGHFLIVAIDRIERRLSEFLAQNRVTGVLDELNRLAGAASDNLTYAGIASDGVDTNALLRRQIARRCIYGIDLNNTAVELARLALWIHTFVKGLPLTSLNHGLIPGNSLTGIGTLQEALNVLDPAGGAGQMSFIRDAITEALDDSKVALARFAATSEATAAEVKQARKAHEQAMTAAQPAQSILNLAVAVRLGTVAAPTAFDTETLLAIANRDAVVQTTRDLAVVHLPSAFPEVFVRDRPGFDCILGNPPWQEATLEAPAFWARHFPGLRSMSAAKQRAEIARLQNLRPDLLAEYEAERAEERHVRDALMAGPYPGMGTGDPDSYKGFIWRFVQVCREGGRIGVVLPRSALGAAGSTLWRQYVLAEASFDDLTLLLNKAYWVFDEVHAQYAIGLCTIINGKDHAGTARIYGPFSSLSEYEAGIRSDRPTVVSASDLASWSDTAAIPWVPSSQAMSVFVKLRAQPRLDSEGEWKARPVTELHATNDKSEMLLGGTPDGAKRWPVYKGESFDLWEPDGGVYYAAADAAHIRTFLYQRRLTQNGLARSAFSAFPKSWAKDKTTLPCLHPRIAFRDVTNRLNRRTVIAALVPGEVTLANTAPYLLWSSGDRTDEAYLLGILCSIPLDWYGRCVIERHLNFHIFNSLPIPKPARDHPLRQVVVRIAGRLAAVDERYHDWASSVGVPVGSVTQAERPALLCQLDAAVALLYGLTSDDVRVLFETFHEGSNHQDRLAGVLAAMHDLRMTE